MSGTANVPNTFANAVTATGAQLDANYSTIVAYVNDPTNRNNYAAGGAATNTVVLTFSPPVAGGYTTGLELTWKWGATNTGGVVLNANGLGDASVVNPDGSALAAGQGQAGSIAKAVYDGTRFIFISGGASPASAATVSAAANLSQFVPPGRMQNHPGVAKAWAAFSGTTTGTFSAADSYNVASIARVGTGTYVINFSTPFTSTNYVVLALLQGNGIGAGRATAPAISTGSVAINVFITSTNAATDQNNVYFVAYGSQ